MAGQYQNAVIPKIANKEPSMKSSVEQEQFEQLVQDMQAVASGRDREAFTRLFDHFVPMIKAFTLSAHPGANILASEVAQEVMLKVWRKAHTYKPETASVSTWIFTLARNARIDYLRKHSRHQSDLVPDFIYDELEDEHPGPFQSAQQRRNEERVHSVMAELPEDQREVLAKVYMEGKTHAEVAEELRLPLGTVKSRVRLALKKLAVSLKSN